MNTKVYTVIIGTGSYIPSRIVINDDFKKNEFFDPLGNKFETSIDEIISKFEDITEIHERRHVNEKYVTSDLAFFAAEEALKDAKIDRESLDYIIVGHNFGDIRPNSSKIDILPTMSSKVKEKLGIKNPKTVAYDMLFGCPGWLQGVIQANYYIKSGDAKRILVIGAEILSRISDPHDRDSMIYADGAGAVVLEGLESEIPVGILAHSTRTDTEGQTYNLWLEKSFNPNFIGNDLFLKMNGRKLYNYALSYVPSLVKECIEKAGVAIEDIKKILIHQANAKMDDAILKRLFKLFDIKKIPENIMPMSISKLGNSSVATVPTLLDFILKGKMPEHHIKPGQLTAFASVGAGMNINCVIYKFPG
jgi:3-oxoacyl-[acyl-carrier-protein] synthase-3